MLSSLGFDNKGAGRTNHSGSRVRILDVDGVAYPDAVADGCSASCPCKQLLPSVPRGFSVHVFKNPTLPTHSLPAMPPPVVPSRYDTRSSNGGGQWTRQQSYHAGHATNDSERKQLQAAPPSQPDHRLIHVPGANQVAWPAETKHKHSKSSKSYGIYPSLVGDVYVYERSISSVSFDDLDELASSPSSESSSSDSDLYDDQVHSNGHINNTATYPGSRARAHSGNFNVEISSTRASSSTETLESTLIPAGALHGTRPANVASALPPLPPLSAPAQLTAPPRPASTRPQQPQSAHSTYPERDSPTVASTRSAVPLTRTETQSQSSTRTNLQSLQRSISISAHAAVPPIQLGSAPLEHASSSDSDSETVISETHANDMVVDMLGAQWAGPSAYSSYPLRSSTPFRGPSSTYRRDAPPSAPIPVPRDARDVRPGMYREDSGESAHPRAPPGLSATPPDALGGARPRSPPRTRDGASASSPTTSSSPPASRSPPSAPPLARTPSTRQSPPGSIPAAAMGSSSYPPPPHALQQPLPHPSSSSPPRRDVRAPSPQHRDRTPPTTASPPGAGQTPSPQGSPTAPGILNANASALVVATTVAKRSVRWTENLVCPSPVPPESRRKGWFNRRG